MKYLLIALMLSFQPPVQQSASDSDFLADFGDVPLMKGLTELDEERIIFDTESGTIAETVLVGKIKASDILAFYGESLKQLGWQRLTAGSSPNRLAYVRDHQILSLRLFTSSDTNSLLVHLEPRK